MARNIKTYGSVWVLVLLLIVGGLAGGALGNVLAPTLPWLNSTSVVGVKPTTLDLHFFNLTFGFTIVLNILTALGMIAGFLVYRRL